MSGIAAIFNQSGLPTEETLIARMASIMTERGPQKQHYWYDNHISLAHCLLETSFESIREQQPSNIARRYWITADARLDARDKLVKSLNPRHPEISLSTTDDQLILHAYVTWGVDCLEHLIGDFAFILWDSKKSQLFCATDHFGVTPLYYSQTKSGVCLSNSVNAIRLHPDITNDLDNIAIADFLMTRTNENAHGTIFKDIKRLAAGHYLLINNENINLCSYWSPKPRGELHRANADTYIEEFSELLNVAVGDRVRTSGIGTHLSGGMDSTSITALANDAIDKQSIPTRIKAYTSAASGSHEDLETPFATEVANSLNIDHQILKKKENAFYYSPPDARNLPPEPYNLGHNPQPHQMLRDVTTFGNVLLTGFGGDPLLSGEQLQGRDINTPTKFFFIAKQAWLHYRLFGNRPFIGLSRPINPARNFEAPNWINENFARELDLSERLYSRALRRTSKRNAQLGMVHEGLWRRIFCWNDPGFTNIPVKVRHPFFDLRLFEYAQTLPRFPWLHKKQLLRESVRNKLPKSIIERPKTGLPNFRAFDTLKENGVPPHFYDLLSSPHLDDYVDTLYLQNRLKHLDQCNHSDIKGIMNTLGLSHWLRAYKEVPSSLTAKKGYQHVKRIS